MSVSETSAMPVGLRSRVPAKITSCMWMPRRLLADCSPRTHEMASATLDLPHPFGPTMAAMPSPWNFSSVRSQNDLNPNTCSFFSLSTKHSFGGGEAELAVSWAARNRQPLHQLRGRECSFQARIHSRRRTAPYRIESKPSGGNPERQHRATISCGYQDSNTRYSTRAEADA